MNRQVIPFSLAAIWLALAFPVGSAFAVVIGATDFSDDGSDGTIAGDTSGTGWAADGWSVEDGNLGGAIVPTSMSYAVPGGGIASATSAVQFTGSPLAAGIQRSLDGVQNGDDIYISFLTKWESGEINGNDFVVWYFNTNSGPNIGYKANQQSGPPEAPDFVARTSGSTNEYAPEDLIIGETYFVVGHLSKTNPGPANPYNQYELWVNPAYGDLLSPEAVSVGDSDITEFTDVGVRAHQINDLGADPDDLLFGRLRIGTTWGDVVPIPEPSALILAACGAFCLFARRSI